MAASSRDIAAQFKGLSFENVGSWPFAPRLVLWVVVVLLCLVVGWMTVWRPQLDEIDRLRSEEANLKTQFQQKLTQSINLDDLRRQKDQVSQYVQLLEKQLPSKAEMDALLSDINQAGVGRGLQFEYFRPGAMVTKDYYAELPIALRISGRYGDLGAFTGDIANLPRIVTLNNLAIAAGKDGTLTLDATAKTFRYLDEAEVAAARKARAAAPAKK
ncbi:MAG: type 4a pilus biogenesis protein PilO [Betaproteobacteria bacterium]|jgi:type IV pilus assembly protein PilO